MRGIAWVISLALIAACGDDDDDMTGPPNGAELSCTTPTTRGEPLRCSLTLPEEAEVRATVTGTTSCEADRDAFTFIAPVVATLTSDGCIATVGTEVDLGATFPAETEVTTEFTPGLLSSEDPTEEVRGIAAVQVEGEYPQWTLSFEDAFNEFPEGNDYDDLVVTLTVAPTAT